MPAWLGLPSDEKRASERQVGSGSALQASAACKQAQREAGVPSPADSADRLRLGSQPQIVAEEGLEQAPGTVSEASAYELPGAR